MTATLEATDLYRFYHAGDEETLALRGVSMTVESGDVVAVTGPSGSGKSTLMACLAGLDEPDGGMVRVNGDALSRRPEGQRAAIRAQTIGVLFQTANLLEHLTVGENVRLAQQLAVGAASSPVGVLLDELGIDKRARALPSRNRRSRAARGTWRTARRRSLPRRRRTRSPCEPRRRKCRSRPSGPLPSFSGSGRWPRTPRRPLRSPWYAGDRLELPRPRSGPTCSLLHIPLDKRVAPPNGGSGGGG